MIIPPNDLIKLWSEYIEWNSPAADDASTFVKMQLVIDRRDRYAAMWKYEPALVLRWTEQAIKFITKR